MNFKRSDRVSELLRHEISTEIQKIQNPAMGFITITGVWVSDDLSEGKVYYSVLGNEEDKKATAKVLAKNSSDIRYSLSKRLESLKKVPFLRFVYDQTPEHAQKMEMIFKEISSEKEKNEK